MDRENKENQGINETQCFPSIRDMSIDSLTQEPFPGRSVNKDADFDRSFVSMNADQSVGPALTATSSPDLATNPTVPITPEANPPPPSIDSVIPENQGSLNIEKLAPEEPERFISEETPQLPSVEHQIPVVEKKTETNEEILNPNPSKEESAEDNEGERINLLEGKNQDKPDTPKLVRFADDQMLLGSFDEAHDDKELKDAQEVRMSESSLDQEATALEQPDTTTGAPEYIHKTDAASEEPEPIPETLNIDLIEPVSEPQSENIMNDLTTEPDFEPERKPHDQVLTSREREDAISDQRVEVQPDVNDTREQTRAYQTAIEDYSLISHAAMPTEEAMQEKVMEFTKNYSDDLLIGDAQPSTTADLADFELPPFSGSSSGSEAKQSSLSAQSKEHGTSASNLSGLPDLLRSNYSRVSHIFRWENPVETGIIFSLGLTLITALTFFSIISVVAYSALMVILTSASIRSYKALMKTLNKPSETPIDNLWNKVLSLDVDIPPHELHSLVDVSHETLCASMSQLKQVLLVEDKLGAVKFGLLLYSLTYIGARFNGMTLITSCYVSLFTIPIFYERNKVKIDEYLNLVMGHVSKKFTMVTSKVNSLIHGSPSITDTTSKKQN